VCICVCVQRVQRAALGGWWQWREQAAALRKIGHAVLAVRDRALQGTALHCWQRAAAINRGVRGCLGAWAAVAEAGRVQRRRERFVVHRLAALRAGCALRAWATAVGDRHATATLVRRAVRRMYSTLSRSALREWSGLCRRGRWTRWTLARWTGKRSRGALAAGWWAWRRQIAEEAWATAVVARCRRRRVRLWTTDVWTRWTMLTARAQALRAAYVRLYRRRARWALRAWSVAVALKAEKVERVDGTLARAAAAMRTRLQLRSLARWQHAVLQRCVMVARAMRVRVRVVRRELRFAWAVWRQAGSIAATRVAHLQRMLSWRAGRVTYRAMRAWRRFGCERRRGRRLLTATTATWRRDALLWCVRTWRVRTSLRRRRRAETERASLEERVRSLAAEMMTAAEALRLAEAESARLRQQRDSDRSAAASSLESALASVATLSQAAEATAEAAAAAEAARSPPLPLPPPSPFPDDDHAEAAAQILEALPEVVLGGMITLQSEVQALKTELTRVAQLSHGSRDTLQVCSHHVRLVGARARHTLRNSRHNPPLCGRLAAARHSVCDRRVP
jgi:hypothetical protein